MALLAGIAYDPPTIITHSCGALKAMTALDTTNLRLTFTAPDSGNVLVRVRGTLDGQGAMPRVMFGLIEGAAARVRVAASGTGWWYTSSSSWNVIESVFTQTGLTPGSDYTWDAAYAVEGANAYTFIKYGGPDTNTSTADSAGAFIFEVWEA